MRAVVAAFAAFAAAVAAVPAAAATPAALLRAYQPIVVLQPTEQFRPLPVEPFVASSDVEVRTGGAWTAADPAAGLTAANPPGCSATADAPCLRLNLRGCTADGGLQSRDRYAAWEHGLHAQPTIYGRVVRSRGHVVVQYWLFYSFNFWSARYPPDDFIWRTHEGDWEMVSVVLSARQKPLYAAYSQHCNGRRRAWARVERQRTHPVVYVALGSHANYFSRGRHLHDPRCYPRDALALFAAVQTPPVDVAGRGARLTPPRTRLVPLGADPWLRFPGVWGETAYFKAAGLGLRTYRFGPTGPAFKDSWRDPIRTFRRWRPA